MWEVTIYLKALGTSIQYPDYVSPLEAIVQQSTCHFLPLACRLYIFRDLRCSFRPTRHSGVKLDGRAIQHSNASGSIEGCQAPRTVFAKAATQGGETCECLET
jgi:hypothetical protein